MLVGSQGSLPYKVSRMVIPGLIAVQWPGKQREHGEYACPNHGLLYQSSLPAS